MKFRLIALAMALASPAFAATTASITTSDFTVAVKDLNTTDSVTARITWDAGWVFYGSSNFTQQIGYQPFDQDGGGLQPVFGTSLSSSQSAYPPSTSLSGATAGGLGSFSISADGNGLPSSSVHLSGTAGHHSFAAAEVSRGFWLTAGTQVSFSALVDHMVSSDAYLGSWTPSPDAYGIPYRAFSASFLSMAVGNVMSSLRLSGSNGFTGSTAAYESAGEADQLKLTIRNTTTTDQYYRFNFSSQVSIQEYLDPANVVLVPEPSSYALMALGLAGVGIAARRRRRD